MTIRIIVQRFTVVGWGHGHPMAGVDDKCHPFGLG